MDIFILQSALGILLFFLINWIGKNSYSIGYMEISMFVKIEEAPALNFLIRVLTPVVYIIVISSILYYLKLDKFVANIYLVNIYYIIFRLLFNIATNRGLLLNWFRLFLYWTAIVTLSYFAYDKLIKIKANILPDFTTIANELWIIILIFIFQVTNNVRLSQKGTERRKVSYLSSRYVYFKRIYGKTIKDITQNEILEAVAFAVLIYEDFNRPRLARVIENLKFRITKKKHTLGVMQVMTTRYLNDQESVTLGTKMLLDAYNSFLQTPDEEETDYGESWIMDKIISNYNTGTSYSYEVIELAQKIKELFYTDTSDTLGKNKIYHNQPVPKTP